MLVSSQRRFDRRRLLHLLDKLEAAPGAAMSVYLPQGLSQSEIEKMLMTMAGAGQIIHDLIDEIDKSTTGAVLFWGEQYRYLIMPPFSIIDKPIFYGYEVQPLRSLLQQDLVIVLLLVRLGAYAIGVFQGEELLSSKVGTGLIHSSHKKGGSSQHRFERHREKQIQAFFDRVCIRAREKIEPFVQKLDYVCYGGERNTVLSFRKRCSFLQILEDRTLGPLLNVREPRQATLITAISEVWSSRVIQWHEIHDH